MRLSCPHAVMRLGGVFAEAATRVSPRAIPPMTLSALLTAQDGSSGGAVMPIRQAVAGSGFEVAGGA